MAPPTPTLHLDVEAISGICGSISIACWVVVFSPQMVQQFQQGNADGLSIQFIIIWLLGDVFNILGTVLQGVLPTMIILAAYYTLADIVLLFQCFYYRGLTWRDEPRRPARPGPSEQTRLVADGEAGQRRGSDWTGLSPAVTHVSASPKPPAPPTVLQTVLWNATMVATVCAAGVLGWFLGETAGGGRQRQTPEGAQDALQLNPLGQVFGYLCAAAYIASRMPQLVLNWRRKTTAGLSMLFFLFACLGNATYVLSILAYDPTCPGRRRCEPAEARRLYGRYMLVNLSWLAGSVVTLLMDLGVFAQHFMYQTSEEEEPQRQDRGENSPVDDQGRIDDEEWDNRPLLQRIDTGNL